MRLFRFPLFVQPQNPLFKSIAINLSSVSLLNSDLELHDCIVAFKPRKTNNDSYDS